LPANNAAALKITIYSKPDCHLCEEAKAIIERFSDRYPLEIEMINIEQDPTLYEQYRNDIPVIFLEGRKLFKYRVDEKKLEAALNAEIRSTKS
jgi:glutaredoxin